MKHFLCSENDTDNLLSPEKCQNIFSIRIHFSRRIEASSAVHVEQGQRGEGRHSQEGHRRCRHDLGIRKSRVSFYV